MLCRFWRRAALAVLAASLYALTPAPRAAGEAAAGYRERSPQDEVIYFVLPDRFANGDRRNDRGGLRGGRLVTGYDPTSKGFYHGGDLAGLTAHLDYIQGLGATAVWLAPIFRNKPVQGPPGQESAGYHGYWVTDFTDVDPHFGTRAAFKAFVDAAHARGMKVYMDIITNHTADVIQYRECPNGGCPYRSLADYPYQRRGGVGGVAINAGFAGDGDLTAENFARLTDPTYAYTPFVPPAEAHVKKPDWLNELIYYHNRGNSTFYGESSLYGDFSGLDDVYTDNPRVLAGFIEVYGKWIDDFGIDGFRIDTARHVNPQFWQAFAPAMLARARARGIPNFHIFGEVYDTDSGSLARYTRVDRLPSVLDFGFFGAVRDMIADNAATDRLVRVFNGDALYEGGPASAAQLPTFLGNHDLGRFGYYLLNTNPQMSDEELYKRARLGVALLMASRGAPTIYYGDEQGFTGDGGDQDAREDMFASRVASYNDNRMIGAHGSTATDNFNTSAPLYRDIAALAAIRAANPALRRGATLVRAYGQGPGLLAFSRVMDGVEILAAFNTGATPVAAQVPVEASSLAWRSLQGPCPPAASAPGSVRVELGAFDFMICIAGAAQ
jgi:glycosidase